MKFYSLVLVACISLAVSPGPAQHTDSKPISSGEAPLFGDLGNYHHAVTTKSPAAQEYFDQGLRLMYGFNHDEAILSFKEAAKLDPDCAMAYWGIALAHGPNYNAQMDAEGGKASLEALRKAQGLAPKASEPERAYIEALAKRYSDDPKADRKALDKAYADAMRELAKRYPDDADAATLFAESMMDLRPWDLWSHEGEAQPGTLEILSTLEDVLAKHPNHPGANHFYVHATEASPHPEKGSAAADRLGKLMPGAGHMVHMPAHTYIRTGRYNDAAAANERAIKVDQNYIKMRQPAGMYPLMYYPHNIHFLWSAASFEGRSAEAIKSARDLVKQVPPESVAKMPMVEYFVPTPYFALVRFGKWDEMLKEPAPPESLKYSTGMWHYARGMAFSAKGNAKEAGEELKVLQASAEATPKELAVGLNSASALLDLAGKLLSASIASRSDKHDEAIATLQAATKVEEALKYEEPPAWYQPVEDVLGAELLKAGRAPEAEAAFRASLKVYPESGWALFGLVQSLEAQKKTADAKAAQKDFKKAWSHADVKLAAAHF